MKSLEPRTQGLLRATRRADDPTDEQLQRVRHSLVAKIAAGGAAAVGLQTVTTSATGASSSGIVAKLLLLPTAVKVSLSVAVIGLGTLGGVKYAASARHAPPVMQSVITDQAADPGPQPAPVELAPPPTAPAEQLPGVNPSDERRESVTSPSPHVSARAAHPAPVSAPLLQEEARLLAEVQSALGAGQGSKALDKLNEYDQRFASGVLRAEADAARVFALCQSGRRADAQASARKFLRRYPSSPSAARVQQACAAEGSSTGAAR